MNHAFSDHFAPVATSYANFRPTYSEVLFAWLVSWPLSLRVGRVGGMQVWRSNHCER